MAVFTQITDTDLLNLLNDYNLGGLVSFEGIEAGVSNTNYFVTTTNARYVLTIFEPHRVRADDIPAYIEYSTVLEQSGIPCPKTMPRKDGGYISTLHGKPAAFFSILNGTGGYPAMLNPHLCGQAGEVLAKMHRAAEKINTRTKNYFGPERWGTWISSIGASMNTIAPNLYDLCQKEYDFIQSNWPSELPSGQIHADYFPDNVFFENNMVTGVIDFHFVCHDFFAYDLAIAINAWSFDGHNHFDSARMGSMMRGYQSIRPLSGKEVMAFPLLLRAASLRFLLSRIEEKLKWKPGDFMKPHDPMVFEKRLRHFQTYKVVL